MVCAVPGGRFGDRRVSQVKWQVAKPFADQVHLRQSLRQRIRSGCVEGYAAALASTQKIQRSFIAHTPGK